MPRSALGGAAAAIALLASVPVAWAQGAGDLPAVTITSTDVDDPNGGQWFAVDLEPGATAEVTARVYNPADQPQTVSLYLAGMTFDGDQPVVGGRGQGVGAWGAFDEPTLTLASEESAFPVFRVTLPPDADPGDHVGAVVVESAPTGEGAIGIVKRVAARLYVTAPGAADPVVAIEDLHTELDRPVLPRRATVTFLVRNEGNVRLETRVTVNGRTPDGPDIVVSRSSEEYAVDVPISLVGGRTTIRVLVETFTSDGPGPTASDTVTVFVFPSWSVLAAATAGIGFVALRRLRKMLQGAARL